jgi:hypothetical protein
VPIAKPPATALDAIPPKAAATASAINFLPIVAIFSPPLLRIRIE